MTLFYFDVQLEREFNPDEFGDAFDTLQEAVVHAQALLPDLARDCTLNEQSTIACELRDERGQVVYRGELIIRSTNVTR